MYDGLTDPRGTNNLKYTVTDRNGVTIEYDLGPLLPDGSNEHARCKKGETLRWDRFGPLNYTDKGQLLDKAYFPPQMPHYYFLACYRDEYHAALCSRKAILDKVRCGYGGPESTVIVGDAMAAVGGKGATVTSGMFGLSRTGDNGKAIAGDFGSAEAGDNGTAQAGVGGWAKAGKGGTLVLTCVDPEGERRILTAPVGASYQGRTVHPDTWYRAVWYLYQSRPALLKHEKQLRR